MRGPEQGRSVGRGWGCAGLSRAGLWAGVGGAQACAGLVWPEAFHFITG